MRQRKKQLKIKKGIEINVKKEVEKEAETGDHQTLPPRLSQWPAKKINYYSLHTKVYTTNYHAAFDHIFLH